MPLTPDPTTSGSTVPPLAWPDDSRRVAFESWLRQLAGRGIHASGARPASNDASFRRYLRVDTEAGTRIVTDAPPEKEDCRPFVKVAALLRAAGLNAPEVLDWHAEDGFMLLSDLGDQTYLSQLDDRSAHALYADASQALVRLQGIEAASQLPAYDRTLLMREMQLFPDWYVKHAGHVLTADEQAQWADCVERIVQNNLAQPMVLVHRDYHSRNLMVCPAAGAATNPGILDFQDAVWGPITYDLASLLRDAYIELQEDVQIDLAVRYWERARKAGLPVQADFGEFWRDFEWMGLQRHLKVLGIFARLYHRDGKDGYLQNLPLVWRYAHRTASRYNGLGALARLLERLVGETRQDVFR